MGTASLRFADSGSASFAHTLHDITQSKSITRQVFSEQPTVCEPSTLYAVPTDLSKVLHPDSYITPLPERSNPNHSACDLDVDVVAYPQSWMGRFPLPQVKGAPLSPAISRGMAMKDILLHDNPAFILSGALGAPDGCKGDLQAEFVKTIGRLKSLGVDWVYMPQWHWPSKRTDGTWYFTKAEEPFGPIRDEDLAFFVATARAAGIKVMARNQAQGFVDTLGGAAYEPPPTIENVEKFLAAFQEYLNERAGFFQGIGIDAWEVGLACACTTTRAMDRRPPPRCSPTPTGRQRQRSRPTSVASWSCP